MSTEHATGVSGGSAMPDPEAAASPMPPGPPVWVLLESFARIGDRRNATTATGLTSARRAVQVSFDLADPPGVSRWFVHCPGLKKRHGFHGAPLILNAADSLVVMLMAFRRGSAHVFDYFVYRAGPGKPSLDLVPGPSCPETGLLLKHEVGVVPCGAGGEHYALAFLALRLKPRMAYDVHVFSSETRAWSVKAAKVAADPETRCRYHDVVMHSPSKAVAAGGGSLAWIDLWRGILLCNVLDEEPVLRMIRWPVPSPRGEILDIYSAHSIRDATLTNGMIRFVNLKFDDDDGASVYPYSSGDGTCTGWTATVWERSISSKDWNRRFEADIASILATDSSHSDSLRDVWDDEANRRGLSKVSSAPPTLSLGDEDVVYFMADLVSNQALVLAVNAREQRLQSVGQTSLELACSTCTFPRFLDSSQPSPMPEYITD